MDYGDEDASGEGAANDWASDGVCFRTEEEALEVLGPFLGDTQINEKEMSLRLRINTMNRALVMMGMKQPQERRRRRRNKMMIVKFMAEKYVNKIRREPHLSIAESKDVEVEITPIMAWRAIKQAGYLMYGNEK
ncbi:hypothetical protein LIER_40819 [Lithospermum erythrorhizon]|uniref:Uncharacterized protein n=1 Tax=Lithospermum erythrorhizon TaxID=34254 RepID=A0AAV3R3B7_LITER